MTSSNQTAGKIRVEVEWYLEDIMPLFLTNRHKEVTVLERALAQQDWANIRRIAHVMHGNGGGYGLPYITELGSQLGQAARAAQPAQVKSLIEALRDYLERLEISFKPHH